MNATSKARPRATEQTDSPTAGLVAVAADITPGTSHRDSPLRREIARVACYEVRVLSKMLGAYIEANDSDGETAPAMRSGLARLCQLSDIIFETAVTDEADETDDAMVAAIGGYATLVLEKNGGAA